MMNSRKANPMSIRSCNRRALLALAAAVLLAAFARPLDAADAPRVRFQRDDRHGRTQILIDGKEALVYRYGDGVDLPHYHPLRSPSGKSMLVDKTEPYPHHRAFWFADTVEPAGRRKASFYNALNSQVDPKDPASPFRDHIRQVEFASEQCEGARAELVTKLLWEMDSNVPVLDEMRRLRIVALANGEYFLDITFTLTAAHGDVTFASDAVHYAWPYLRVNETFNGEHGGTIADDLGQKGEAGTNMKPAKWIDYSNTVDGAAEGLAVFQWPDGKEHRWLTREYGTFGPRRPDEQSGKPFTLKRGESIVQRVGVLVHAGNVESGRVAERYQQYIEGKL